jgi:UDP-3-O-[3-hydroxymyristoyl] glucosamine N-acyltransferase
MASGPTVSELAAALGLAAAGDLSLRVARPASPADGRAGDIVLAMEPRYERELARCGAEVGVLRVGADWQSLGLRAALFAPSAREALARITGIFWTPPEIEAGIHPLAAVHPSAAIGPDAAIGPFVSIGREVRIGARARILSHASIAEAAEIGADALILEGVRIGRRVRIGDRFIAHPNAVIGADGFSYVTAGPGPGEGAVHRKVHALGSVRIGDDVELGACTCIDRGTLADTVVGSGTKIDNLVQVGHNVRIGADGLICGSVAIAGSAEIGDRVVLGGMVGVADHVRIGSDVMVAGGSLIGSSLPGRQIYMGIPALPKDKAMQIHKLTRRLPELHAQVAELQKRVSKSHPTG